jgi:hypothetical protein
MRRPGLRPLLLALGALAFGAGAAAVQPAPAQREFLVEPIAERIVAQLPEGPLHWRIETFASLAAAQGAAGPLSLAAEHGGRAWLFTLGAPGGATPGGTRVAEIGPVPVVRAERYMLRVNRAGGPPGAATPVHAHPGSEAFYVLAGSSASARRTASSASRRGRR